MTRPDKAGGKAAKAQRRKTLTRRNAPKVGRGHRSLSTEETNVSRLTRERDEALDQQTAMAEVLRVISSSPTNIQAVLDMVGENAARLCDANNVVIWRLDGDWLRLVAQIGQIPTRAVPREGIPVNRGTVTGRAVFERRTIHTHDLAAEDSEFPEGSRYAKIDGHRTTLATPLLREGVPIGAILIRRTEVRPFSQKQIDLLATFADQAVIAIENARLLNDLNKLNQQLEQRVTDQVGEIERMGRRGFTGFSESSDPEDVMALLREYHAAIGGIINKYGGTLERYAGDAVMVVFNDPIPVDKPALQAVLMAIDMRAAIGELIEKWRKLGHDIGFGIGIAHGFATLGTIGFEGRFDYAAIGTVSNVASRLCDEAKPGQILISPRVFMAVQKDIEVEPVGEFALKGIRRPLATYNVVAVVASGDDR